MKTIDRYMYQEIIQPVILPSSLNLFTLYLHACTNMSSTTSHPNPSIPILLLKSPSPNPATDPYTTHLTSSSSNSPTRTTYTYIPLYTPVLTHTLLPDALISLLLTHLQSSQSQQTPKSQPPFPYGALIFTSQRAVAAFSTALTAPPIRNRVSKLRELEGVDFYTVGPATERALVDVRDKWVPGCRVFGGKDAGSGEVLAGIMLGRGGVEGMYRTRKEGGSGILKPVLFLTGEKRRDIIPRTLMDAPGLREDERIQVDEMVVYETRELEEFEFGFGKMLRETDIGADTAGVRWIVVFSPTAGRGMLKALGWLGNNEVKVKKESVGGGERKTFVACIGPTTREYLESEFGFEADVVAGKPSPEGVREGIERFMREKGL